MRSIKDFKPGETIEVYGIISLIQEKVKNDGGRYINFTLEDKTGSLDCKIWDATLEEIKEIKSGYLVGVIGTIKAWNGVNQLTVQRAPHSDYKGYTNRLIKIVGSESGIDIKDFVKTPDTPTEIMLAEIEEIVASFNDEDFKQICTAFLSTYKNKLQFYPAAMTVHHAISGGLLQHMHSMVKLAISVSSVYISINRDLLVAGAILHDVGKFYEFDVNNAGKVQDYTVDGNLLGHSVLGMEMIDSIGNFLLATKDYKVNPKKAVLLKHMIASHHSDISLGALIKPSFIEAELLHHLDMIDSRMNMFETVIEETEIGSFSATQKYLNGRRVFNHGL